MNVIRLPLSFFVDKLNAREPFAFARYGDGELQCALGMPGENCDGTVYASDLVAALRLTLTEPRNYLYAIGPKVTSRDNSFAKRAKVLLENCNVKEWHSTETFLNASLAGELGSFIAALQKRQVMLIGAAHLRKMESLFSIQVFVETPQVNAWNVRETIAREIMRQSYQCDTLIFCAGMTSKVLTWELYPHLGATHTLIDCGSLWDMYCGMRSRSYARRLSDADIERLKRLNLGEREASTYAHA